MPSEITHKSAFKFGPILWAMALSFFGGYVLHGYYFADAQRPPEPCPAAVSTTWGTGAQ